MRENKKGAAKKRCATGVGCGCAAVRRAHGNGESHCLANDPPPTSAMGGFRGINQAPLAAPARRSALSLEARQVRRRGRALPCAAMHCATQRCRRRTHAGSR